METFGYHLIIDGYTKTKNILESEKKVRDYLLGVCKEINMTPILGPFTRKYIPPQEELKDKWGYSGILIIAESHIAVHTFPEYKAISIDVYSCKEFNQMKALSYTIEFFEIKNFISKFFRRGANQELDYL